MAFQAARLFLIGGPIVAGAVAGAYKMYSDWLASENGKRDMAEKFGVRVLNLDDFKEQLTDTNEIGKGGFGTVFRCRIDALGQDHQFAVKVLDRELQAALAQEECQGSREFYRELEILAPCRHPNILRVVAVSVEGRELALVYPYVAGGDLEQRLHSRCTLAADARANIAFQVLNAMMYLHADYPDKPPILHRDIKPQNILLDCAGGQIQARLTDFGSACMFSEEEFVRQEGNNGFSMRIVGTRGYVDPTGVHEPLDQRSDVYSLGVVFLRLLTGQPALAPKSKPLAVEMRQALAPTPTAVVTAAAALEHADAQAGAWPPATAEVLAAAGTGMVAEWRGDRLLPADVRAMLLTLPVVAAVDAGERDRVECAVCMAAPRTARFLPCGHLVTCRPCAESVRRQMGDCCVCREPIVGIQPAAPMEPAFVARLGPGVGGGAGAHRAGGGGAGARGGRPPSPSQVCSAM